MAEAAPTTTVGTVGTEEGGGLPSACDLRDRLFSQRKAELETHVAAHLATAPLDAAECFIPYLDWMEDHQHAATVVITSKGFMIWPHDEKYFKIQWKTKEIERKEEVERMRRNDDW